MTTQAIIESNKIKTNLLSKTESAIEIFFKNNVFKSGYKIYLLRYLSLDKVIRLRNLLNSCTAECEAMCLSAVAEDATSIRDILEKTRNILIDTNTFPSIIFAKMLWEPLIEWDDLVEDCALSADKEFRDLISQLAEVL